MKQNIKENYLVFSQCLLVLISFLMFLLGLHNILPISNFFSDIITVLFFDSRILLLLMGLEIIVLFLYILALKSSHKPLLQWHNYKQTTFSYLLLVIMVEVAIYSCYLLLSYDIFNIYPNQYIVSADTNNIIANLFFNIENISIFADITEMFGYAFFVSRVLIFSYYIYQSIINKKRNQL